MTTALCDALFAVTGLLLLAHSVSLQAEHHSRVERVLRDSVAYHLAFTTHKLSLSVRSGAMDTGSPDTEVACRCEGPADQKCRWVSCSTSPADRRSIPRTFLAPAEEQ